MSSVEPHMMLNGRFELIELSEITYKFFVRGAAPTFSTPVALSNQLNQPVDNLIQILRPHGSDPFPQSIDRNCPHLRYLHPRRLRKCTVGQRQSKRKASSLRLTRNRHRYYSLRAAVEDILAKNKYRSKTNLLAPTHRIKIRPLDVAPQDCGHEASANPSSAIRFSS